MLRDIGVTDRAGVAGLPLRDGPPRCRRGGHPQGARPRRRGRPGTSVGELLPEPRSNRGVARPGITTAAEVLARLDPTTTALGGSDFVPRAILDARAVLGSEPIYRLPGERVAVDRFDVEIDVDMENAATGEVYLWGALVTDRADTGLVEPGYPLRHLGSLDGTAEYRVFAEFWNWLSRMFRESRERGVTVGAFFWTATETTQMRRITTPLPGLREQIDEFVAIPGVDRPVPRVYGSGWTNGVSASLKPVATAVGFSGRSTTPTARCRWSATSRQWRATRRPGSGSSTTTAATSRATPGGPGVDVGGWAERAGGRDGGVAETIGGAC